MKGNIIKILVSTVLFLIISINTYAEDVWVDYFGTSSTSGTWDTGTRYNPNVTMKPPLVLLWQRSDWRGITTNVVGGWNQAAIVNGYIYLTEGDLNNDNQNTGYAWAWNSTTGVTKTSFPLTVAYGTSGSPCVTGGYISAGTDPGGVGWTGNLNMWDFSSLNPIPGFPVSVETNTLIDSSPIIKDGRVYVSNSYLGFSAMHNTYLYCYNATNGNEIYKNLIYSEVTSGGSVSTAAIKNGKIVILSQTGGPVVYCFNESDGSNCTGFPVTLTGGGALSSPVIYNNKVYFGSTNNEFYAIDLNTATVPAPFPITLTSYVASTAAIGEGKVYFGTGDGKLYGIDAQTGIIIPGFPVDFGFGERITGPATLANGVVYCGSSGSNILYAVDANNGTILWQYNMPSSPAYSGLWYFMTSVAENKLVAVSAKSNGIFVFVEPSPTVTPTITPTYTMTVTQTFTQTVTATNTITATITETETMSETHTITQTHTITPTHTNTPTPTPTQAPFSFKLITNYPNPFKDETYIVYELGKSAEVKVKIYTISGERVVELTETGNQGKNRIYWNAENKNGNNVASGIYIYSIEATAGEERAIVWSKCAVIK